MIKIRMGITVYLFNYFSKSKLMERKWISGWKGKEVKNRREMERKDAIDGKKVEWKRWNCRMKTR